jgi:serine/threonine-protein kinase
VEKAILWAMALHPDDRPASVIEFREALLGKQEAPDRDDERRINFDMPSLSLFPQEQLAAYAALGLFLIGLIVTLLR